MKAHFNTVKWLMIRGNLKCQTCTFEQKGKTRTLSFNFFARDRTKQTKNTLNAVYNLQNDCNSKSQDLYMVFNSHAFIQVERSIDPCTDLVFC